MKMGARPQGAQAWLAFIAPNTTAWWTILWLSALTDLLFLPVAIALYIALNRIAMLLAAVCVALFVLDLAITRTNYAALITLGGKYAQAAGIAHLD